MQLKEGDLEGIILEIMNECEGIVELDGNKIRVSLPDGVKKGDKVAIRVDKKDDNIVLKVGGKDKPIPIKVPEMVAKEKVFHIKIPEKVNIKDVILNIKKDVLNLKKAVSEDKTFKETINKIEKFIDSETITLNKETSTKKLAGELQKYVKKSGINYENKLKTLSFDTGSLKSNKEAQIKEIKNDVKYKINSVLEGLYSVKETAVSNSEKYHALDRLIINLTNLNEELENWSPEKGDKVFKPLQSAAVSIRDFYAASPEPDVKSVEKAVDFLIKTTNFMESAGALAKESLTQLIETFKGIRDVLLKTAAFGLKEDNALKQDIPVIKELSVRLAELENKLNDIKAFLVDRSSNAKEIVKGAAREAAAGSTDMEKAKEFVKEGIKDTASAFKGLKRSLKSLISELSKLKPDEREAWVKSKDEVIKRIETLIKDFSKLLEGVEYQQLSNLKAPEANLSYLAIPMMFDEAQQSPEIVITSRKSKKNAKGENENRVEIFLDLKNAGHVKADFNVTDKYITGDFFSVRGDTVKEIEENIPSLKESLKKKDFNVIRINSKKVKKALKCDVNPEDKLALEDINIFDFKV
jgi:hypothetical protein